MRLPTVVLAIALPMIALPLACEAVEPSGAALVAALKAGGHVIYFRHGHADQGIDKDAVKLGPCAEQRGLSTLGRADAVQIGRAFKRLAIPHGDIHASPYCRAIETAFLAFGSATVDHDLRLWHGELSDEQRDGLPKIVKAKLARALRSGTNTVYVAHNYKDVLGIDLQQGEAAILRPDGDSFAVMARVMPGAWDAHLTKLPDFIVSTYALPAGTRPRALAGAKDGAVWFAPADRGTIGRLDPFLGRAETISLTADGASTRVDPEMRATLDATAGRRIAVGSPWRIKDGALFHLSPQGASKKIALPTGPITAATAAPDGAIWIAQAGQDRIVLARPR